MTLYRLLPVQAPPRTPERRQCSEQEVGEIMISSSREPVEEAVIVQQQQVSASYNTEVGGMDTYCVLYWS